MPDIFISYRREDAIAHAGRLYDRLAARFGNEHVFMDLATIKPGEDFVEVLENTVGACDVFVAVVGRGWLSAADDTGGRRIDTADDFVRREIEIALHRNIRVIPVLVQGSGMPKLDELPQPISALAKRQAFHLPDAGFHRAVDELIAAIEPARTTPTITRPLTMDSLKRDERELLDEVRSGKYIDVKLESFIPIAVLSGQITESELHAFLTLAQGLLSASTNYYATGEQDAIVVGNSWKVFISRTYNQEIFRNAQAGIRRVINYLLATASGTTVLPAELLAVSIKVRGMERFFDINGIPGSGERTWVGFDLRR